MRALCPEPPALENQRRAALRRWAAVCFVLAFLPSIVVGLFYTHSDPAVGSASSSSDILSDWAALPRSFSRVHRVRHHKAPEPLPRELEAAQSGDVRPRATAGELLLLDVLRTIQ